jgi:hypothetical protein
MTRILKAGGLWLLIAAVIWLTTIWRWQSAGHEPGNGEIFGQLFVLPVLLAATCFAALWMVKRMKDKAASPVAAPAAITGVSSLGGPEAAVASDDADRHLTAWILAEALHLTVGDESGAAWATLGARSARPALDAELQDVDGFPVMAGRVAGLDVEGDAALEDEPAPDDGEPLSLSARRGLALLVQPLAQLLSVMDDMAKSWPMAGAASLRSHGPDGLQREALQQDAPTKAHLSGVAAPVSMADQRHREATAPQLRVRVLLPAHWRPAEREAVVAWLRRRCGALLDWATAVQARGISWHTDTLERPEAFWDELDQAVVQWSRDVRPDLWLVLAVDSALDPSRVEHMQSVGDLFTGTHQTGRMPGEGAVGLLLANAHWPRMAELVDQLPGAPMRMWRPVRTRRDKSADALGRVGTTALNAAIAHAVGLCVADKDGLVVVADADHRASRGAELFESLQEALPGLDPMVAVTRVGEACGELGMAGALASTALACAALRAGDGAEHALAVHLQSSHDRVVVALAPWRPPAVQA